MPPKCKRDKRGWLIPRNHTVQRAIYDLKVFGFRNCHISFMLQVSTSYVNTSLWKMRNSKQANEYRYQSIRKRRQKREVGSCPTTEVALHI